MSFRDQRRWIPALSSFWRLQPLSKGSLIRGNELWSRGQELSCQFSFGFPLNRSVFAQRRPSRKKQKKKKNTVCVNSSFHEVLNRKTFPAAADVKQIHSIPMNYTPINSASHIMLWQLFNSEKHSKGHFYPATWKAHSNKSNLNTICKRVGARLCSVSHSRLMVSSTSRVKYKWKAILGLLPVSCKLDFALTCVSKHALDSGGLWWEAELRLSRLGGILHARGGGEGGGGQNTTGGVDTQDNYVGRMHTNKCRPIAWNYCQGKKKTARKSEW